MKYCGYVVLGALCLTGACAGAAADHQNQAALTEQHVSSKEMDAQIDSLAAQIINGLSARKINKIALIEFSNLEGSVTGLGKYMAEELTTRLFRTGRFQVVERRLMNKIMEEQKLSATGLVDEKTASKFGRILGADALAIGTIAELNTSVKINARLIAAETGAVFAVASVQIPMSKEIEILLGKKPAAPTGSGIERFEGTWDVNIVCPPKDGGIGYAIQFPALVKDGVIHGQYGTDGIGPCLTLDGKIGLDGSSIIKAKGLTGDPKYSMHNVQKSFPYSYHIDANFSANRGTGTRIELRSCNATFFKQ
jgi:TolB-like protein